MKAESVSPTKVAIIHVSRLDRYQFRTDYKTGSKGHTTKQCGFINVCKNQLVLKSDGKGNPHETLL